jgi:hypothetical protein
VPPIPAFGGLTRTSRHVAKWPETEVPRRPRFGRYRELSGPKADIAETTLLTHNGHRICRPRVALNIDFVPHYPPADLIFADGLET